MVLSHLPSVPDIICNPPLTHREKRREQQVSSSTENYQTQKSKASSQGKEMCGPSDAVFKQRTSDPRTGSKNAWPALMVP
jgi:hypothetical protein